MEKLNEAKDTTQLLKNLFKLKETGQILRVGKLFNTNKNNYFYDTGTGKVLLIDDNIFKIFNILFNEEDKTTYEEFKLSLNENLSESVDELMQSIKKENILLAPLMDRLYSYNHYENLENKVNNELEQIILELTGRCNLRCGYCIYNDDYEENRNFNEDDMSKDLAKKVIDYAKECATDEGIAICFYGGEPLLKFDLLKWCIDYTNKIFGDKKHSFAMTTNLTLVTKEIAEFLASVDGMSVLCSLDGPENVQNAYRKYSTGVGSFNEAVRGLKYLVDAFKDNAKNKIAVNAVFAPPYTFEKLAEINKFFKGLDWLHKETRITIDYVASGSVSDKEHINELMNNPKYRKNGQDIIDPLGDWQTQLFDKYSDSTGKTPYSSDGNINRKLLKIHNRMLSDKPVDFYPFNSCCVPGSRRLYVNTKGEFSVCERIGKAPNIGNVFDGINFNELKKHYIDEYSNNSIGECSKCWAARICGICYVSIVEDGINKEVKAIACDAARRDTERSLVMYHSILENNPEKLESLNSIITS
ncbi:radical SAM protein [Clostridium sp. FP2]|uniref:radical SAM protein n=1 Tax=Clostridium sp. FP2 TaxID=2724481 RepID=UPI0013E99DE2|nr:radical SAM protein [Clostridium sp. FP2]MBZ9626340.1 radical SAM protein [Clostridium sp. FP2]